MKPYVADPDFTLYNTDAREGLAQIEPGTVQTIVTSPPYFLLRDYATGEWVGGDPAHAHDTVPARGGRGGSGTLDKRSANAMPSRIAAGTCSCGARHVDRQIGNEASLDEYVAALVDVFRAARDALSLDGTLWLNLGDTHSAAQRGPRHGKTSRLSTPERQERVSPVVDKRGRAPNVKPKDLFLVPFEVARALREDGWWLRQTVIWDKTNTIPESAKDRPTTSHEYLFLLSKASRYYYDAEAIAEPATWERWGAQTNRKAVVGKAAIARAEWPGIGKKTAGERLELANGTPQDETGGMPARATRNARSVWRGNCAQFPGDHAAVMPDWLAERCILATSRPGDIVLDPFAGAGTTALAARGLGRRSIGLELSAASCAIASERLRQLSLLTA